MVRDSALESENLLTAKKATWRHCRISLICKSSAVKAFLEVQVWYLKIWTKTAIWVRKFTIKTLNALWALFANFCSNIGIFFVQMAHVRSFNTVRCNFQLCSTRTAVQPLMLASSVLFAYKRLRLVCHTTWHWNYYYVSHCETRSDQRQPTNHRNYSNGQFISRKDRSMVRLQK